MRRYSVACRGSLNEKAGKCFLGGGWMTDEPNPPCPYCHKPMFCTAVMDEIPLGSNNDSPEGRI